jgi:hypothetical protein
MFSQFFGGGCTYTIVLVLIGVCLSHPSSHAVQAQDQVRRGPTSVSEFEVSLADIYTGASIDVRPVSLTRLSLPIPPAKKKKKTYIHQNKDRC